MLLGNLILNKTRKWFFLGLISVSFSFELFAQNNWELQKEESGFKVFTRVKQGSEFKESKVTGKVKVSLTSLVSVFQDVNSFINFMPDCDESKLLKMQGDTLQIYYMFTNAPWPVDDRDGIYQFNYSYNPDSNCVIIAVKAVPEYSEAKQGNVRIKVSDGRWKFTELADGYIDIEYTLFAKPGGSIPAWLANSTTVDMPLKTALEALKQAQLNLHKGKKYNFIK